MQLFQLSCGEDTRHLLLQLLASSAAPEPQQQAEQGSLAQDLWFEALQLVAEAPDVTLLADGSLQQAQAEAVPEDEPIPAETESQSVVALLLTRAEAELSPQLSHEMHRVCAGSGVVVIVHRSSPSTLLRGATPLRQMNVFERQLPVADATRLLAVSGDASSDATPWTVLLCCRKHVTPVAEGDLEAPFECRLENWNNVVVPDLSHLEEEEQKTVYEPMPAHAEAVAAAAEQARTFKLPSYVRQDPSILEDKPFEEYDSDSDRTPAYFDWRKHYPELQLLLDNLADIQEEAFGVANWVEWPEQHYSDGGSKSWKVVPFMYTFPAYDASKITWVDKTCARCPKTVSLLRQLPRLRTALFSRLGPSARISAHTGWQDLANYVLRCHLSLKIPPGNACGLWVDGEVRLHRPNEIMVFDDSKLHRAFNESDEDRIVLILDMARPEGLPIGEAQGGHTAELDNLIQLFS